MYGLVRTRRKIRENGESLTKVKVEDMSLLPKEE